MAERNDSDLLTTCVVVLAIIASVAALYFASELLVPIALAAVLSVLLRPVVRWLQQLRVPPLLGATIVVLGLIAIAIAIGFALTEPVKKWIAEAPQHLSAAEARLNRIRQPVKKVADVADKIEHAAETSTTAPTSQASAAQQATAPPAQPASAQPAPITRLLGTTTQLVGGATEVVLLLFLILASGGMFLQKLMRVSPSRQDKKIADDSVHEAESVVLRYVLITALINLGQGIIIALIMWWLKMPSPLLWGVFTFVMEFIPYLGSTLVIAMLAITALATFDDMWRIILPPFSYLIVTTLQNNLVSPLAYGRGLRLNPVAVLIGVLFWWFVWGIAGAFLAMPIIAMMKVLADRAPRLRGVAEFLGE